MRFVILLAALAVSVMAACAPAPHASHALRVTAAAAVCPHAADKANDGCASAPPATYTFRGGFPAIFPHGAVTFRAPRSASAHPYFGDLPALDYPIGVTTPIGQLANPATAPLPVGCKYMANSPRTGFPGGSPELYCDIAKGGDSLTVSGYDMTGVWLEIDFPNTCAPTDQPRTLRIANNYFKLTPGQNNPDTNGSLMKVDSSVCTTDATYESNTFDGSAPALSPGVEMLRDNRGSGNTLIRYNAWLNPGGRTMTGPWGIVGVQPAPGHWDFTAEYNFVYGNSIDYPANDDHGEFNEFGGYWNPPTIGKVIYRGNVVVTTFAQGSTTTALIWPSDGAGDKPMHGQTLTLADNLLIANAGPPGPTRAGPGHSPSGSVTSGRIFGLGGTIWNSVVFSNNRLWAAGAWFCFSIDGKAAPPATTWSRNVNLFDGSAIIDFDGYPRPTCHGTWGWKASAAKDSHSPRHAPA